MRVVRTIVVRTLLVAVGIVALSAATSAVVAWAIVDGPSQATRAAPQRHLLPQRQEPPSFGFSLDDRIYELERERDEQRFFDELRPRR